MPLSRPAWQAPRTDGKSQANAFWNWTRMLFGGQMRKVFPMYDTEAVTWKFLNCWALGSVMHGSDLRHVVLLECETIEHAFLMLSLLMVVGHVVQLLDHGKTHRFIWFPGTTYCSIYTTWMQYRRCAKCVNPSWGALRQVWFWKRILHFYAMALLLFMTFYTRHMMRQSTKNVTLSYLVKACDPL